jgi:hypothetical protein
MHLPDAKILPDAPAERLYGGVRVGSLASYTCVLVGNHANDEVFPGRPVRSFAPTSRDPEHASPDRASIQTGQVLGYRPINIRGCPRVPHQPHLMGCQTPQRSVSTVVFGFRWGTARCAGTGSVGAYSDTHVLGTGCLGLLGNIADLVEVIIIMGEA